MARFKGELQDVPKYLADGLQVLADQTDEQPWPIPEMSRLLRALSQGCAIRYGGKGYFEVVTRTFHIGMVSEMMCDLVLEARRLWWEEVSFEPFPDMYYYKPYGTGTTQRRKGVFRYETVLAMVYNPLPGHTYRNYPSNPTHCDFDAERYVTILREQIVQLLNMAPKQLGAEQDGEPADSTTPSQPSARLDIKCDLQQGSGPPYQSTRARLFIHIAREPVLSRLGFPANAAD